MPSILGPNRQTIWRLSNQHRTNEGKLAELNGQGAYAAMGRRQAYRGLRHEATTLKLFDLRKADYRE